MTEGLTPVDFRYRATISISIPTKERMQSLIYLLEGKCRRKITNNDLISILLDISSEEAIEEAATKACEEKG